MSCDACIPALVHHVLSPNTLDFLQAVHTGSEECSPALETKYLNTSHNTSKHTQIQHSSHQVTRLQALSQTPNPQLALVPSATMSSTLTLTREQFLANWVEVEALGFDDIFRRMWEFYLAYCEAGFRSGYLDDAIITIERPSS